MSVLRLLATGKSLVGMKDQSSPYRMRTANLLPKFESTKNPFAPKAELTHAEEMIAPVVLPAVAPLKSEPAQAEPVLLVTPPLFDAQLQPAIAPVPAKEIHPALTQPAAIKVEPMHAMAVAAAPVAK